MTPDRVVQIVFGTVGVIGMIVAVLVIEAVVFHEESTAIVRAVAMPPMIDALT